MKRRPYLSIMNIKSTQFAIGQLVRHRTYPFRGVIVDVDAEYNNSEEWWQSIPEAVRPRKDQPFLPLARRKRNQCLRSLCIGAESVN